MTAKTRSEAHPAPIGARKARTPLAGKMREPKPAHRSSSLLRTRAGLLNATKQLSGPLWVARFPGSKSIDDLTPKFRMCVEPFVAAMVAAGAKVTISATLRPPERMYLMHWSWRISHSQVKPWDVPPMPGVDIEWSHGSLAESIQAAQAMVAAYSTVTKPSLTSKHGKGTAIDMTIRWKGELTVKNAHDKAVTITSSPRNGMNPDLVRVGESYGVIKAAFSDDPPHWSNDGH
ncbi:hypothetical protein D3C87_482120 [compost metagenome]